jgi:hypothetical protein
MGQFPQSVQPNNLAFALPQNGGSANGLGTSISHAKASRAGMRRGNGNETTTTYEAQYEAQFKKYLASRKDSLGFPPKLINDLKKCLKIKDLILINTPIKDIKKQHYKDLRRTLKNRASQVISRSRGKNEAQTRITKASPAIAVKNEGRNLRKRGGNIPGQNDPNAQDLVWLGENTQRSSNDVATSTALDQPKNPASMQSPSNVNSVLTPPNTAPGVGHFSPGSNDLGVNIVPHQFPQSGPPNNLAPTLPQNGGNANGIGSSLPGMHPAPGQNFNATVTPGSTNPFYANSNGWVFAGSVVPAAPHPLPFTPSLLPPQNLAPSMGQFPQSVQPNRLASPLPQSSDTGIAKGPGVQGVASIQWKNPNTSAGRP